MENNQELWCMDQGHHLVRFKDANALTCITCEEGLNDNYAKEHKKEAPTFMTTPDENTDLQKLTENFKTAVDFIVKDSGKRDAFSSGMVRDTQENKTDYSRVFDGPMLDRWAEHITKGAVKYPDVSPGVPNWTLANGENELIRFKKSAIRHFRQWLRGDTDEDHASACYFNINGFEFVKAKLNEKK